MPGQSDTLEGLGLRRWATSQTVELVRNADGEPALMYRPEATARDAFPEWFDSDYEPQRSEDGTELQPRDLFSETDPWKPTDDARLFSEFVGLVAGPRGPESFEEFARRRERRCLSLAKRFGVLRLCAEHGLPVGHTGPDLCRPTLNPEPIRAWWEWAVTFRAIKRLADDLRSGARGSENDWATVLSQKPESIRQSRREGRPTRGVLLAVRVSEWLEAASFRPYLSWPETASPALRVLEPSSSPTPHFAALVRQLAHEVTGARGTYVCNGCDNVYSREAKKPKPGQNNYCPTCRTDGTAARIRQRQRRARNQDES